MPDAPESRRVWSGVDPIDRLQGVLMGVFVAASVASGFLVSLAAGCFALALSCLVLLVLLAVSE